MTENLFKWKHYESGIIILCIRWYLKYPLSYRMLVEMMAERGWNVTHTTIMRWVHQYSPILDERIRNPQSAIESRKQTIPGEWTKHI